MPAFYPAPAAPTDPDLRMSPAETELAYRPPPEPGGMLPLLRWVVTDRAPVSDQVRQALSYLIVHADGLESARDGDPADVAAAKAAAVSAVLAGAVTRLRDGAEPPPARVVRRRGGRGRHGLRAAASVAGAG